MIDSKKLDVPRSISIIQALIVATQVIITSIITYYVTNFSIHPALSILKMLIQLASFILVLMYSQAITNWVILRITRPSINQYKLLMTIQLSTFLLLPLIPFPQIIIPFLRIAGAKIGRNVIIVVGTIIIEPHLLEIGDRTQLGAFVIITVHVTEKDSSLIKKIKIGSDVLVGAKTIIQPGVEIGNNSVIAMSSNVKKNTVIPANTLWGGTPAMQRGRSRSRR